MLRRLGKLSAGVIAIGLVGCPAAEEPDDPVADGGGTADGTDTGDGDAGNDEAGSEEAGAADTGEGDSTEEGDEDSEDGYGDDDPDGPAEEFFLEVRLMADGVPQEPIEVDLEISGYRPELHVIAAPVDDEAAAFVVVDDQLLSVAFDGSELSLVGQPISLGVYAEWAGELGGGDFIVSDGGRHSFVRRLDGSWDEPMTFNPMFSAAGTIADVDGDLSPDLMVVGWHENGWSRGDTQDIRCGLGFGDGSVSMSPVGSTVGSATYAIQSGDFNGDGTADFVLALDADGDPFDGGGRSLGVALGTGACELTLVWERLIEYTPERLWVGELDGSPGLDFHTGQQLFVGDGTGELWIPLEEEATLLEVGAAAGDEAFDDRLLYQDYTLLLQIDDEDPIELSSTPAGLRPRFTDVDKDGSPDIAVVRDY